MDKKTPEQLRLEQRLAAERGELNVPAEFEVVREAESGKQGPDLQKDVADLQLVRSKLAPEKQTKRTADAQEPLPTLKEQQEALNYYITEDHGVPLQGTAAYKAMELADAYEGGDLKKPEQEDEGSLLAA